MDARRLSCLSLFVMFLSGPAFSDDKKAEPRKKQDESKTYDRDSVLKDAEGFFGKSTEGLAK